MPPLGALLGGSSGVVVLPISIVGILFSVAGVLTARTMPPDRPSA